MKQRLPLVWLAGTAAMWCACVGSEPGASRHGVVGGAGSADDAVVAVLGDVGDATYLCSGVLIAPRTVLTSAHCVHDRDAINVVFGPDIHDQASVVAEIAAESWVAHPSWQSTPPDLFDQRYDLGLVLLASDAPAEPAMFNRIALAEADIGADLRIAGYGDTANGAYDSGKRLEASTTLRAYDDWWTTAGAQDANSCVGDSGGPQLMTVGGGEVVVGVTSFGTAPPGEELCRFDSIAARVDIAAADFIDAFIAENDTPGACGADGTCSDACATPAQDPDCEATGEPDAGPGLPPDAGGQPGADDTMSSGSCSAVGARDGTNTAGMLALLALAVVIALRPRRA